MPETRSYIIIAAFSPFGRPLRPVDGEARAGFFRTLSARAGAWVLPLLRLAAAPAAVRRLLPRGAGGWVAAGPVGRPVTVTVTWVRAITQSYRGPHSGRHTRTVQRVLTRTTTVR